MSRHRKHDRHIQLMKLSKVCFGLINDQHQFEFKTLVKYNPNYSFYSPWVTMIKVCLKPKILTPISKYLYLLHVICLINRNEPKWHIDRSRIHHQSNLLWIKQIYWTRIFWYSVKGNKYVNEKRSGDKKNWRVFWSNRKHFKRDYCFTKCQT